MQCQLSEYERVYGIDLSALEKLPEHVRRSPAPVTVVVCTHDQEGVIGRCLDSILRGNPAEIIVVDCNSTDATSVIARAKGATVVSDRGAGLGAARQLGASLAHNEYVVFVDGDVVVEPDTFEQLVDEAQEEKYDVLQAELRTLSVKSSYWQYAERRWRQLQATQGVVAVLGYQATIVRRDLLMKVGFDPEFGGAAEDFDFSFRARVAGAVIANSTRTVAYLEDLCTPRVFAARRIWWGHGVARMLIRYGRGYVSEAAAQVDALLGGTRLTMRNLPYLSVSWIALALGVTVEIVCIAFDPGLRRRISEIPMVQDKANA